VMGAGVRSYLVLFYGRCTALFAFPAKPFC
jgi:hypothetical protein